MALQLASPTGEHCDFHFGVGLNCSYQPSMVHCIGWIALSFLVRPSVLLWKHPTNLHFFNIYRHTIFVLNQFNLIPNSTKLHWPSATKYQPVPPHTDPVLSCINQFQFQPQDCQPVGNSEVDNFMLSLWSGRNAETYYGFLRRKIYTKLSVCLLRRTGRKKREI